MGENIQILKADLDLERRALPLYREAIGTCETNSDFVIRRMLSEHPKGEEEQVDWLETQLALIVRMGLENYLQSQV